MRTDYLSMKINKTKKPEEEFAKLISRLNEDAEGCIVSCKICKVTDKDTDSSRFFVEVVSWSPNAIYDLDECDALNPSEVFDDIFPLSAYLDINPECGLKLSQNKIQTLHRFYVNNKDEYESMNQFVPFMHCVDIYDFEKFVQNHFEFYDANKNEIRTGLLHSIDLKGNSIKSNYFSTLNYLVDWFNQKIKYTELKDVNKDFVKYFSTFMSIEDIFTFIGSVEQSACIEYLMGIDEGIYSSTYKLNQYSNPYNVSILKRIGETGYQNGYIDNLIAKGFDYNQLRVIKNACELQVPFECVNKIANCDCDPIIMETYVYAINYNVEFGSPFSDESFDIILKSTDSHKARLILESIIDGSFNKMKKYFEDPEYNILQLKIIKMGIDDDLEILYADKSYSAVDMFFLYLAHKNISNEPMRFLETDEIKKLISDKILSDINKLKSEDSKVNFIGDYINIDLDKMYMDWETSFVENINRTDSLRLIDTDRYGYKNPQEFLNIRRNCKKVLKI